jgi:hypothetical protein
MVAPTNYYRDFRRESEYLAKALFLPEINNERTHGRTALYKKRFESLNSMTMFKYTKDPIIYPKESEWFGEEVSLEKHLEAFPDC